MTSLFMKPSRQFVKHVVQRSKYTVNNSNLKSIILDMPRPSKHTAALKLQRQKNKEKSQKYIPGIVTLQVLGSGANGAPRSLYVFTDQSRYMFNCGEGAQRLAHEHKMKLAKLEHIFFTYGSWENIGGLPGISLTIQDVGVPEITVHGPPGIVDMFSATRRFIILKDLSVKTADYNENPYFEDNVMRVKYIPLKAEVVRASRRTSVSLDRTHERHIVPSDDSLEESGCSGTDGRTTDDETDYYAHERGAVLTDVVKKKKKKRKHKRSVSVSPEENLKRRRVETVGNIAMSYICKLNARPGALCLEACVERGVPPGPLLGRLKAGEDVTLPNGQVVKSSDVTLPDDPGPVFIVVECPSEKFLEPLLGELQFVRHQTNTSSPDEVAYMVVHFTPPSIVQNPRYKGWMDKFPSTTKHLMINDDNVCMGSIAVHRIQQKLHILHPQIFPLLSDNGIPVIEARTQSNGTDSKHSTEDSMDSSSEDKNVLPVNSVSSSTISSNSSISVAPEESVYHARTFSIVQLRPHKHLDRSNELCLNIDEYKKEVFQDESMEETLKTLQTALSDMDKTIHDREYPSVVFLGTGSCIPNKTRNTSGILLNIGPNTRMLMDCGEGTYGQLVRFYGTENIGKVMSSLQAIYVSHLHADHHIGLIGLLKARQKYNQITANHSNPLFLMAPKQIMTWLNYYNDHFESILQQVALIPNGDLVFNNVTLSDSSRKKLCDNLSMSAVLTTPVMHCPNSYGIAIKHTSGWKITYSGDTMPCDSLVELGQDSTLLIHEATMEDELVNQARMKMHSTTSEAIDMGKKMNAEFTLLTHFSQRYATLPRFNDNIKDGVGIAFDNMKVRFTDLRRLPLMYPALKLMFSSHQEELEQKAYRRQMKELKMANSRSPSTSRSSSPSKQ